MNARSSKRAASATKASLPKESDYQKTIVAAATTAGWYVHAERPAVTSNGRWLTNQQGKPGFPDLVLCHPARRQLVFVELKRKPNKPTADQLDWIHGLTACGIDASVIYVPDGLLRLLEFLGGTPEATLCTLFPLTDSPAMT